MRLTRTFLLSVGLCLVAVIAIVAVRHWHFQRAITDLVSKTRDNLIFVEGGTFEAGNYRVNFVGTSGQPDQGWAADSTAPEPYSVELASYYISAYETVHSDFELHLTAQGRPSPQRHLELGYYHDGRGALMFMDEATHYCSWLGEQTGVPMRLPTEAEWEFAARSRGQPVIWATDDGGFRSGKNVYAAPDRDVIVHQDARYPAVGSFAPNPLGLYNLADGLYEWVSDRLPDDPDGAAIYKGGSNFSSLFYERIPARGVSERWTAEALERYFDFAQPDEVARIKQMQDPLSPKGGYVTARCVAEETRPPSESGFGVLPSIKQLTGPFWAADGG